MIFPTTLYITPGKHACMGGTFSSLVVNDADELIGAIEKGYWPTIELAFKKPESFNAAKYYGLLESTHEQVGADTVDDVLNDISTPPTREEIETKARELKIKYTNKTSDETLLEKIEFALNSGD